jgi:hypothetical protein
MYILSILLGSVIDAPDASGICRRSSLDLPELGRQFPCISDGLRYVPDTPNLIGSFPVKLLGSFIDASDAFGVSWRCLPDTPSLIGSFPVSLMVLDMFLLSDVHSLEVAR